MFVTSTNTTADVLLRDPYLRTLSIGESPATSATTSAVLEPHAVVANTGDATAQVVVRATLTDPTDGRVMGVASSDPITINSGEQTEVTLPSLSLPDGVKLWWPHTHGEPFLYAARYDLLSLPSDTVPGTTPTTPSLVHSVTAAHGVRTISTHVDPTTTGRVFEVNGVAIFLQGGNWIATDQVTHGGGSVGR